MRKVFFIFLFFLLFVGRAQAAILSAVGFETGTALESVLGGSAEIQASVTKHGGYALHVPSGANYAEIRGLDANGAIANVNAETAYVRFYYRFTGTGGDANMFEARNSSNGSKMSIDLTTGNKLQWYSAVSNPAGTPTATLSANTWYMIEVLLGTGSPAAFEIKVDGTTDSSGTENQDPANLAYIVLKGNGAEGYFDSVLLSDTGYPGAGVGLMAVPNGDGNYTAWGTGEASDNDEVPHDSDTTFATTSGAGTQAETFAMGNFTATGINTVKPIAIARNVSGAANTGLLRLRSNTTDSDTTAVDPGATYVAISKYLDVDPATAAAWTESGINAAEVGYVKTQAEAREMRMTAAYLYVDAATLSLGTGFVRRIQPIFFQ